MTDPRQTAAERLQECLDALRDQPRTRGALLQFIREATPALVSLDTCGGSASIVDDLPAALWVGTLSAADVGAMLTELRLLQGTETVHLILEDVGELGDRPWWHRLWWHWCMEDDLYSEVLP